MTNMFEKKKFPYYYVHSTQHMYTEKKVIDFPVSPAGMLLTKLSLAGNNWGRENRNVSETLIINPLLGCYEPIR
jgi:hypothetical protein